MGRIRDIADRIDERYAAIFNVKNLIVGTIVASLVVIGIEIALI